MSGAEDGEEDEVSIQDRLQDRRETGIAILGMDNPITCPRCGNDGLGNSNYLRLTSGPGKSPLRIKLCAACGYSGKPEGGDHE